VMSGVIESFSCAIIGMKMQEKMRNSSTGFMQY